MTTQQSAVRLIKQADAHMRKYLLNNLLCDPANLTAQEKRVLTLHRNRFNYLDALANTKLNIQGN
jgi:hypothetical protein